MGVGVGGCSREGWPSATTVTPDRRSRGQPKGGLVAGRQSTALSGSMRPDGTWMEWALGRTPGMANGKSIRKSNWILIVNASIHQAGWGAFALAIATAAASTTAVRHRHVHPTYTAANGAAGGA